MIFSSKLLAQQKAALTAEGYPLVFSSTRDKQARDWSITGANVGDIGDDGLYHLNVVNSGKNLFNAKTGRTVKSPGGSWANTAVRTGLDGNGIYIGLSYSNYYNSANCTSYEIIDDNSVSVASNSGYGLTFDFKVKPNTSYTLSHNSSNGQIAFGFYTESGNLIRFEYLYQTALRTVTTPTDCYYMTTVFSSESKNTVTFENIKLVEGAANVPFEPYREPVITEVTLDEPINGTATYKSGVLPALSVCKGTNFITVEATNVPTNMTIKY